MIYVRNLWTKPYMPCVGCWYIVDVAYIIKFVSSTCFLGSNPRGSFPHLAGQKPNNKVGYNSWIITMTKRRRWMNFQSIFFILVMMMSCFECGWLSSIRGLVDPYGWKVGRGEDVSIWPGIQYSYQQRKGSSTTITISS